MPGRYSRRDANQVSPNAPTARETPPVTLQRATPPPHNPVSVLSLVLFFGEQFLSQYKPQQLAQTNTRALRLT